MPWRTISHRKIVNPHVTGLYVYSFSRIIKQLDDEYLRLYGLETDYIKMKHDEYNKAEYHAYRKLNEADILKLAQRVGGNYIVRKVNESLQFPVAYKNNHLVIYRLPK